MGQGRRALPGLHQGPPYLPSGQLRGCRHLQLGVLHAYVAPRRRATSNTQEHFSDTPCYNAVSCTSPSQYSLQPFSTFQSSMPCARCSNHDKTQRPARVRLGSLGNGCSLTLTSNSNKQLSERYCASHASTRQLDNSSFHNHGVSATLPLAPVVSELGGASCVHLRPSSYQGTQTRWSHVIAYRQRMLAEQDIHPRGEIPGAH